MPKKPVPTSPDELQRHLNLINLLPKKAAEWRHLREILPTIVDELESLRTDDNFRKYVVDSDEMELLLTEYYRKAAQDRIDIEYRELALYLTDVAVCFDFPCDSKAILNELAWLKDDRRSLHEMIRTAQDNDGGGWFTSNARRLFGIENGLLFQMEHSSVIDFLYSQKLSISRLNICPVCDKVYWQKLAGEVRKSETCGVPECSKQLANMKSKWKREEMREHLTKWEKHNEKKKTK